MNSEPGLPTIDDGSRPYWDAYREGRFLVARCGTCRRVHHYPRAFCPFCWSDDVSAVRASGRAILYSYSTVHVNDLPPFREQLPYVAAMVELEEGPRVMTMLVDCEPADLRIGMALTVRFRDLTDQIAVPVFGPAG
ncbi:MAG: hypothetical protein JWN52_459 [Actinomycetia bacterium]|nr:hypothetical protein [Actinomycetes bacterium]